MVNLQKVEKSQDVALDLGRDKVMVGLGWQSNAYRGLDVFDLDLSAFMLLDDGKVVDDESFIFYNQLESKCGSVVHTGDLLDGGEEVIYIDFRRVPRFVKRIVIAATIHEGDEKGQCFGQVNSAYLHIVRLDNRDQPFGGDVLRFDLTEDYSLETAVVVGEIYRSEGDWRFFASGSGQQGGLAGLCQKYGVNI